jgi:hypothetical protein
LGGRAALDLVTGNEQQAVYPSQAEITPTSLTTLARTVAHVVASDGYLYALDLSIRTYDRHGVPAAIWPADVGASNSQRLQQKPLYVSGAPALATCVVYVGSEDQSV